MARWSAFLVPTVSIAIACSSATNPTPAPAASSNAQDAAPAAEPDAGNPYPEGPYGNTTGTVLGDQEFAGYYRTETTGLATASTYEPLRFSDLRTKATVKYALVHTSAYWCGICKASVAELVKAYPTYADKAIFVDILVEGATPDDTSTKTQLDSWAKNLKVPYTVMRDPDGVSFRTQREIGPRKTLLIVELQTMQIIYRIADDHEAALAKLKSLN